MIRFLPINGGSTAMKFVSFARAEQQSYGLLLDDGSVLDLPAAAAIAGLSVPLNFLGFLGAGAPALAVAHTLLENRSGEAVYPAGAIKLLAPIPRPTKNIFCVGRNYHDHVVEGYRAAGKETKLPAFPQFFTKAPTAVIPPVADFPYDPALTKALDYEVEVALVIGKAGRDIPRDKAMEYIFGVTVMNDITGRDLQRRHEQWFKGKSLDNSAPLGPCVVTLDSIPDISALELKTLVNGEERQHGRISQLIFDIPEIIMQLSAGLTLEPGDIIATGTPSGVGYAMEPPNLLKAGDVVECSVSGIGTLVTTIVAGGPAQ
jgi:2-keto-4-pentenoate hydratase/2-oxohepta-3-ene-1,7-dioic acid hydratase in catechol pathway